MYEPRSLISRAECTAPSLKIHQTFVVPIVVFSSTASGSSQNTHQLVDNRNKNRARKTRRRWPRVQPNLVQPMQMAPRPTKSPRNAELRWSNHSLRPATSFQKYIDFKARASVSVPYFFRVIPPATSGVSAIDLLVHPMIFLSRAVTNRAAEMPVVKSQSLVAVRNRPFLLS